jgi:hypothetical protein
MISKVGINQEKGSNNVQFLDVENKEMPEQPVQLQESEVLGTANTKSDPLENATIIDPEISKGNIIEIRKDFPETESNAFFKTKREKIIFFAFIAPPLAISFISMMHLISLFATSNSYAMAVAISVSIELASMSSLVALVTLNKLNKFTIWSIFFVLSALQIVGNMYHTYINTSPESLKSILDLLALSTSPWSLRFVMFMIGGILPVISLTFVKGIVDYFKEK